MADASSGSTVGLAGPIRGLPASRHAIDANSVQGESTRRVDMHAQPAFEVLNAQAGKAVLIVTSEHLQRHK